MCQSGDKSHVEAWKSLIELSKTTISIASAILTALIGFYVLNQESINATKLNYLAPLLLIFSMVAAMYGFGRAIRAIKTGNSETSGVVLINVSVLLLAAGVLSISLIDYDKSGSLDRVLSDIERETKTLKIKLTASNIKKVDVVNSDYLISYESAGKITIVTYSGKENRIIKLE
ncbi:hypothetical protein [Nitrosomonas sp. Nm132]|jgi:hypothetical protein|uniref:hypothetical protein n=1 Tax=Nitrosomonas sp. Nm132 TaxID=1881053 RepID=UPI000880CE80|nr:hypothetical protein [Nitrosomonas sp. Nm132]SDI00978.1 hypothetical protein SAMN05428952_105810 [Nitrosomonas sp. Nm132]